MERKTLVAEILDQERLFDRDDFLQAARLSTEVMDKLLDEGILQAGNQHFHGEALCRVRKAMRLHDQLGINWPGVALALDLLDRIDELEKLLAKLNARHGW